MTPTLLVVVLLSGAQAPGPQLSSVSLVPEAVACGPRAAIEKAEKVKPPLTVAGTLADGVNSMYAPWHRLVVSAGADQGVRAGQQYFVRRMADPYGDRENLKLRGTERYALAVITAGWLRIDAVEEKRSIATIIHSCSGIIPGDYLEPFEMPTLPKPMAEGTPDYGDAAQVLFGTERARVEGAGRLIVIDRGSKEGIQPGQHFTLFRTSGAGPNAIVAKGVAVEVRNESAMIVLDDMRDAIYGGDKAAPHH